MEGNEEEDAFRLKDCNVACEQALLFGRVKRVARERASERRSREGQRSPLLARSRETRFACPNRTACSQANCNAIALSRFFQVMIKTI